MVLLSLEWPLISRDVCNWLLNTLIQKVFLLIILFLYREVLASVQLLNMPERVDWKACKINRQEEETHAEDFRRQFEQFDFTLE